MGEGRVELAAPLVGDETLLLLILPTRDLFGSACTSSGPGLKGRLFIGGDGRPLMSELCLLSDWDGILELPGGERRGGPCPNAPRASPGPEREGGAFDMLSRVSIAPPSPS